VFPASRLINNSRERYLFNFNGILTLEAKQDEVGRQEAYTQHMLAAAAAVAVHPSLQDCHTELHKCCRASNTISSSACPVLQVFERVARPVVVSSMQGFNGTIFAYGQTGSGKTFTITGGAERYVDRGIIPRTIACVYSEVAKQAGYTFQVSNRTHPQQLPSIDQHRCWQVSLPVQHC
jgi:hypothetical protein